MKSSSEEWQSHSFEEEEIGVGAVEVAGICEMIYQEKEAEQRMRT